MQNYDIILIGAGVIGTMAARELSRYNLKILLLEKENDISCGATKANSGIVHGGYDAKHGTIKSQMSRKGNRMFRQLEDELHFGYLECGSLVLAFSKEEMPQLEKLKDNGEKNGVDDLSIIGRDEILQMEPNINPEVHAALYCPTAGIASPYELAIALAENAIANGVALKLRSEVSSIIKTDSGFTVNTPDASYNAEYVINCAGLYSDRVAAMLGADNFSITPRRGEYILLHKDEGKRVSRVLFQAPTEHGKGILVTRTVWGNLMLGPNSQYVDERDDVRTNLETLEHIVHTARRTLPDFNIRKTLRSFAGLRATSDRHDFVIEESSVKNFINVGGIESPGLTSSPAIAQRIISILKSCGLELQNNTGFDPIRKPVVKHKDESFTGSVDSKNPDTHIICRCESVTESEINDALHRGIFIDSLDAVKRRTRAGMGPCQGNFCGPRVAELISRENGIPLEDITPRGKGSSSLPHREDRMFWKKIEE